jgi:DNA-binding LacI/PurR family transcriptional regulator
MAAATDLGYVIPDSLAVVGFDNIATSRYMRPSLTTMDMPAHRMGAEGMRLLLRVIAGETVPSRTVFDAELLIRQSSVLTRTSRP